MIAATFALIGAALTVSARSYGVFGREGIRPRLIAACVLWTIAAIGLWLASRQQGFDLARTGLWTFGWRQLGCGFLFGALGLMSFPAYIVVAKRFGDQSRNSDTLESLLSGSVIQRLFLLATAAGAEEIVFRAVAIGSLMAAGVAHGASVALPLVVFVLVHRSSWSIVHLLFVALAGMLMTGAFLLAGIWAAIIAHLIVDAPMMLAGKAIAERARRTHIEPMESR